MSSGGDDPDLEHLGVRAFARVAPVDGWSFRWTSRIPRERGLGSSASVIALGLVAASLLEHGRADPEELFPLGLELEGHGDNLAAALAGGVCLTWDDADRQGGRQPAVRSRSRSSPRRRSRRPLRERRCRTACRTKTRRSRPAARRSSGPRSQADRRSSSRRHSTTDCTSRTAPRTPRCSARSSSSCRPARSARRSRARARP